MYNESCTSRAGSVLPQAESIPKLSKLLQESPNEVIADFEEIRKYSKLITIPSNNDQTQPIYNSHGPFGHEIFGHWECLELD
jgi:hypothetical protein